LTKTEEKAGSVVAKSLPLRGKTVLVTRPKDQAEEFSLLLSKQGANVVFVPTIQITSPESWEACDTAISQIHVYDAIIFTSANAVHSFLSRLDIQGSTSAQDRLRNNVCYVVGSKTGEALVAHGIVPSTLPGVANGRELAETLSQSPIDGRKFLFPQGNLVQDELAKILRSHGAQVDEVTVYDTVIPLDADAQSIRETIEKGSVDVISFFSPSSVKNFLILVPAALVSSKTIAAIGTSTATAAKEMGLHVHITPIQPTSKAMVDAIVQYFNE
jgi:uroporphyrinogen-III synthase